MRRSWIESPCSSRRAVGPGSWRSGSAPGALEMSQDGKTRYSLHILLAYCYIFENLIFLGHNRQERGCLNNKLLHWQDNYTCPAEVSGTPSALTSADQILKLRFCLEGNSHFKMESEMKVHLCVSLFVFSKDLRWGKLPQPAEAKLPCSSYSETSCKQYNDRGGGLAVGYKLNSSFS